MKSQSNVAAPDRDFEYQVIKVSSGVAAATTAAYLMLAAISDSAFLVRSIGPAVITLVLLAQVVLRKPLLAASTTAAGLLIVVQVSLVDSPGIRTAGLIGLLMMGVLGAVAVTRHRRLTLIAFSALVVASQFIWFSDEPFSTALGRSVVALAGMQFSMWVIIRSRQAVDAQRVRYRNVFERAPIAIWEEDFTGVSTRLTELRRRGIADLRSYLDDNPDEVAAAAALIRITAVNPATVELLAAGDASELLGPLRVEGFTDERLSVVRDQLVLLWEGGTALDTQLRARTRLGEWRDMRLRWVVPVDDDRRDFEHCIVTVLDVTELVESQRRLTEMVESKDRFIASVSHELRTPLTAVVGLSAELVDNLDRFETVESRDLLGLIAAQASDVGNIVEDLLVAARADIGKVAVEKRQVDVGTLVAQLLATVPEGRVVGDPRSHTGPNAVGDAGRIRQILRNLLSNAIRYGGPHVSVSAGQSDEGVWVEVSDDGEGVREEDRELIFAPYYTAHTVPGRTASVGLGLTVSRQLAQMMDGDLTYSYDGTVSVFRLLLPAA